MDEFERTSRPGLCPSGLLVRALRKCTFFAVKVGGFSGNKVAIGIQGWSNKSKMAKSVMPLSVRNYGMFMVWV